MPSVNVNDGISLVAVTATLSVAAVEVLLPSLTLNSIVRAVVSGVSVVLANVTALNAA